MVTLLIAASAGRDPAPEIEPFGQMIGFGLRYLLENDIGHRVVIELEHREAVMAVVFMLVGELEGKCRAAAFVVARFRPDTPRSHHDIPVALGVRPAVEAAMMGDELVLGRGKDEIDRGKAQRAAR